MAQAAKIEEEVVNIPAGGIADFVMEDDEVDEVYGKDEEVSSEGIGQFTEIAKEMADAGREGDDFIAHVESGELIIPKDLLEKNPEMKDTLFAFLESNGVEDPERYIVGSSSNSINPETGAPEFFFRKLKRLVKKTVKKIARGVKKVVKKIGKVLKKIAPIVLPILGTMVFGPIWGAALGSGIATLIQGGSPKDALKSALIGGVTGGIGAGVGGAVRAGSMSGFVPGVQQAAQFGNLSTGFNSIGNAFKGDFSGISVKNMAQGPLAEGGTAYAGPPNEPTSLVTSDTQKVVAGAQDATTAAPKTLMEKITTNQAGEQNLIGKVLNPQAKVEALNKPEIYSNAYKTQFKAMEGLPGMTPNVMATSANAAGNEAVKAAVQAATPSFVQKAIPYALTGTALAGATGMFKVPEQEEAGVVERDEITGEPITGEDLITENPEDYLIGDLDTDRVLDPETGEYVPRRAAIVDPRYTVNTQAAPIADSPYRITSNYKFDPYGVTSQAAGPFARPTNAALQMPSVPNPYVTPLPSPLDPGVVRTRPLGVRAFEEGGEVYPRRNGGIMPNEGIPNQDSVRAMLMPGEFVMTTDAVKGMGNGNMNQGINNMYSVMRNLENRGRLAS